MKKLIIIVLFVFLPALCYSQEIKATVTVNSDLLDINARNMVSDLGYQIESYVGSTRYTDIDWEGEPIDVRMNITFSSGGNNSYMAQLYVEAVRPVAGTEGGTVIMRAVEQDWGFNYAQGGMPTYNEMRFDNFASIIDYYMLLAIGQYLDATQELGGSPAYSKLRQLVSLGSSKQIKGFQMISSPGEFTKYNLMTELTDPRYDDFRLYVFDYYDYGLDEMSRDEKNAILNLEDIVLDMRDFKQNKLSTPSVLMQLFFDSKARELASLFSGNNEILDVLRQLDPSNGQEYNSAKE